MSEPTDSTEAFTGYRWTYLEGSSPVRLREQEFLDSVDRNALVEYASLKRNGTQYKLIPNIGSGYNHMVRIIEFDDGMKWIARLRIPRLPWRKEDSPEEKRAMEEREYNTIQLLQKENGIPVPMVHAFEARPDNTVGAPFMLMDCLRGKIGMGLGMKVPSEYKTTVFTSMAEVHVELFRIQLPKIGPFIGQTPTAHSNKARYPD